MWEVDWLLARSVAAGYLAARFVLFLIKCVTTDTKYRRGL